MTEFLKLKECYMVGWGHLRQINSCRVADVRRRRTRNDDGARSPTRHGKASSTWIAGRSGHYGIGGRGTESLLYILHLRGINYRRLERLVGISSYLHCRHVYHLASMNFSRPCSTFSVIET